MVTRFAGYALCALLCVTSYPVEAQESKNTPRLGFLSAGTAQDDRDRLAVFSEGLRELGYVEAKNILIEYRFADGKLNRLPELAIGLVRLNVTLSSLRAMKPCKRQKTQLRLSRLSGIQR